MFYYLGVATRENARLKKELADLGRQVCHLLREIEQLRSGSSSNISTDQDMSDSLSSADIITKRLVTFSDIAELQNNNQRLLALVRELSERQEEAESYDPVIIAKLKTEIESLREQQRDNLEQLDKQNKMMATVMNQRDMYKTLYGQAVKGTKSDSSMEDQDGEGNIKEGTVFLNCSFQSFLLFVFIYSKSKSGSRRKTSRTRKSSAKIS